MNNILVWVVALEYFDTTHCYVKDDICDDVGWFATEQEALAFAEKENKRMNEDEQQKKYNEQSGCVGYYVFCIPRHGANN